MPSPLPGFAPVLGFATVGALLGSAVTLAAAPLGQDRGRRLSKVERRDCTERRGQIRIAGLSGNEMCALPYADGGRRCTSGSQCEGQCLLDADARTPLRPDRRTAGRCETHAYGFGCRTPVEDGRAGLTMCVD